MQKLAIRPYARLLTMLGDQLIKNERIALVELIKNAYDADAGEVEVRFENFNDDMSYTLNSQIVVQDNGDGMTFDTVRTQWMNPAAARKHLDKQSGNDKTLNRERIIQGEKGIGRFAVLKLGKYVTVTTRPNRAKLETRLVYDFTKFDDDFLFENDQQKEIFLDQITVDCRQEMPEVFAGVKHGTIIEIKDLKGSWSRKSLDQLARDIANLTDPVSRITRRNFTDDFKVGIFCNGQSRSVELDSMEMLKSLVEDKPVLAIRGNFDTEKNVYFFTIDSVEEQIRLQDAKITGLWVWRQRFKRNGDDLLSELKFMCGSFSFQFYVFDFSRGIDGRYALTQIEKDILKKHRIYLYRDNVRVYPYGDPDDDWLNVDVTRGTGRAGNFFSNDQIVGWIDITHRNNPALRDKTSREGLIETGGAVDDLIFLVQTFLSYVKQYPYARYQERQRQRNIAKFVRDGVVAQHLADMRTEFKKLGDENRVRQIENVENEYNREKSHLTQRTERTEDLAGVGLSVEMASHDIMLLMGRAQEIVGGLARTARIAGDEKIREQADMLVGVVQQIATGLRDVQLLFKSSRRRRKALKVEPILDKIHNIYRALLEEKSIAYRVNKIGSSPLTANATDGVIMQVLINLFDNAAYWLETIGPVEREIQVTVDSEQGELIFSDSGPGVDPEDETYIFEAFYSGKGQAGRGLGLYIARQLLERYEYRIAMAETRKKVLQGANFVVNFAKEED